MGNKPPFGVKPKKMLEFERTRKLSAAIFRHLLEKAPINIEWVEEYNELTKKYNKQ